MDKKKVAILAGHSTTDPGAVNTDKSNGLTTKEYDYNSYVVNKIVEILKASSSVEPVLVKRDVPYSKLPDKVNALSPKLVLEFHCNAASNVTAGGSSTLYSGSAKSKPIAAMIQTTLLNTFKLRDRGLEALAKGDRGATLIFETNAPCFIIEPFFISNEAEETKGVALKDTYAKNMAATIEQIVAKGLI